MATQSAAVGGGVERAFATIKQMILSGRLPAGHTLVERQLCEVTELSRTPVREALRLLQGEGLVTFGNRGTFVTPLDPNDVRELYDLRICLEAHSINEAFRGSTPPNLSAVRSALGDQEAALDLDDVATWVQRDKAFHIALLRLHPNSRIEDIMERAWDGVIRCALLVTDKTQRQDKALQEHKEIMHALVAGTPSLAVEASRNHLQESMKRVLLGR